MEMLELLATAPNLALNAQTHGGHTPLHLAKQLGHADMQDRLLKVPVLKKKQKYILANKAKNIT